MIASKNPPQDKISELIQQSEQKAAKWLKDLDTGDLWYWPAADWTSHHDMAKTLHIENYEKGIAA